MQIRIDIPMERVRVNADDIVRELLTTESVTLPTQYGSKAAATTAAKNLAGKLSKIDADFGVRIKVVSAGADTWRVLISRL